MPQLMDLPLEIYIDNLLPCMEVKDILHLACTDKSFATICSDETFWKRRLQADYNFNGAGTARDSGWKLIYRGLYNPKVYVWGQRENGRLGLSRFPKSFSKRGVPFPTRLRIPKARIVNLIAGGMQVHDQGYEGTPDSPHSSRSFHALDSEGNIHVWGTLDGSTGYLRSDGYSEPGNPAATPLKLEMPAPTRAISCGRLHASSLDARNQIWTFLSWGRPFCLQQEFFTGENMQPIQIECGWTFSSVLTKSGDVFVWWPFNDTMNTIISQKNAEFDTAGDKKAVPRNGVIPCVTWTIDSNPLLLPPIPELPDYHVTEEDDSMPRLVKIAGLDGHLIGLTDKGHVLKFGTLEDAQSARQGRWTYLPEFSEVSRIQNTFRQKQLRIPQNLRISHISGNFLTFMAYSTGDNSVVLMGDTETNEDSVPKVIPELQYKSVISVVLGDYHKVALTSTGKVLTWGGYQEGALGLGDPTKLPPGSPGGFASEQQRLRAAETARGDPPAVETPAEVSFSHGSKTARKTFCFSIAAAGWHSGALVIDLEDGGPDAEDEYEYESEDEYPDQNWPHARTRRLPPHTHGPIGINPTGIPPPFGAFRIGFAGRGAGRGQGA